MLAFLLGLCLAAAAGWILVQYYRQNNRLLAEELQRVEQEKTLVLEFLHNLVEEVGDESPRQRLPARIVHAAVRGTGAVSGCLFAPAGDRRLRAVAVEGLFPPQRLLSPGVEEKLRTRAEFIREILCSEEVGYGEGVIGAVAETGEAILVNDAGDERLPRHGDPVLRVCSLLAVPMFFRKRFLGVLAVANASDAAGFSETDCSLVRSLGEQAALAMHNAEQLQSQMERQRLDLDLSLAANVQGMLLPRSLPEIEGLEIAAVYEPAQRVGGDLYNVFSLPGGRVGVAVADVSGKGVASSLLMAICQTSLSLVARDGAPPKTVLSRMNREIIQEIRPDMFVTMIYAVIDPAAGQVRLARAGHELPVLFSPEPDGAAASCRTIESEGMALGMVPAEIFDPVLEEIGFAMPEGAVLALYSDGITEQANAEGDEFGTKRLLDGLRRHHALPVDRIRGGLLDDLERFAGSGPVGDDRTLLVAKAVPKGDKPH